jgi:hypothetical protein
MRSPRPGLGALDARTMTRLRRQAARTAGGRALLLGDRNLAVALSAAGASVIAVGERTVAVRWSSLRRLTSSSNRLTRLPSTHWRSAPACPFDSRTSST